VTYNLRYTVLGQTRLQAIANAVAMLRSNVQYRGIVKVELLIGRSAGVLLYWDVTLSVSEDV
jgi:hypothetical protein